MHNELFSIGPFTVYGYGLMIAIGILAAIYLTEYQLKKRALPINILYPLAAVCVVFGLLGAKLLFVIVEWKQFVEDPGILFSMNGFVVYGGVVLGILAAAAFLRYKKQPFWDYFDMVLPSVAVAQGFGRIGCFLAGCCYGRETDAWYGIAFSDSKFAPNGVKLIPTQLISSAGMFTIAIVCFLFARKNKKAGRVGALYLVLYSVGRTLVEELRSDKRGAVGTFSTAQFISIFIVVFGVVLFVTRKTPKTVGEAVTEEKKEDSLVAMEDKAGE